MSKDGATATELARRHTTHSHRRVKGVTEARLSYGISEHNQQHKDAVNKMACHHAAARRRHFAIMTILCAVSILLLAYVLRTSL